MAATSPVATMKGDESGLGLFADRVAEQVVHLKQIKPDEPILVKEIDYKGMPWSNQWLATWFIKCEQRAPADLVPGKFAPVATTRT